MMQEPKSRREMLKLMLAASGGIGLAAFLPNRWLKPVVKSGVLPVHARASGDHITLNASAGCYLDINSATISPKPASGTLVTYTASGVDNTSATVVLTPNDGSANTDSSGYVDFSDSLGYDPTLYTPPIVFTVIITAGSITESKTVVLNIKPSC
jgi:hypothetical protein